MVTPLIPAHKLVFILVDLGTCVVARYIETRPFHFEIERAVNEQDLAADAFAEATNLIGALSEGEHLPCSPELAERATWEAEINSSGEDDEPVQDV